jgi:hypothetical protein
LHKAAQASEPLYDADHNHKPAVAHIASEPSESGQGEADDLAPLDTTIDLILEIMHDQPEPRIHLRKLLAARKPQSAEQPQDAKRCAVLVWRSNEHPGGTVWIGSAAHVIESYAMARAEAIKCEGYDYNSARAERAESEAKAQGLIIAEYEDEVKALPEMLICGAHDEWFRDTSTITWARVERAMRAALAVGPESESVEKKE